MTSGAALEDCCGADLLQMTDVMMVDSAANSVGGGGVGVLPALNNSVISVTMAGGVGSGGAASPTSMLHNGAAISTQSVADYLAQLLKDKKQQGALPNVFHHVERLLDEGTAPPQPHLLLTTSPATSTSKRNR